MARKKQLELHLPTWGGKRKSAGRKPKGVRAGVSHGARPALSRHHPVHVTWRMLPHVWNLRSRRCFAAIAASLARARHSVGFRIVHFSVQGNHIHLVVEATNKVHLARGLQGFAAWMARRVNAMMRRRGKVFADRYHAHQLKTVAETRNAVRYAVTNYDEHARRRGEVVAFNEPDPYSSANAELKGLLATAQTWLLRRASGGARLSPGPADMQLAS